MRKASTNMEPNFVMANVLANLESEVFVFFFLLFEKLGVGTQMPLVVHRKFIYPALIKFLVRLYTKKDIEFVRGLAAAPALKPATKLVMKAARKPDPKPVLLGQDVPLAEISKKRKAVLSSSEDPPFPKKSNAGQKQSPPTFGPVIGVIRTTAAVGLASVRPGYAESASIDKMVPLLQLVPLAKSMVHLLESMESELVSLNNLLSSQDTSAGNGNPDANSDKEPSDSEPSDGELWN